MGISEPIPLKRDCQVIEIPSGDRRCLPERTSVRILQSLGGSYTLTDERGRMYRMDADDSDALGLQSSAGAQTRPVPESGLNEKMVWDQLRTIYDPEIPVNLVDLGLIYSCVITSLASGKHRIDVKMSMTAPGCGMGNVLKADVETKLRRLPQVESVHVEVVFDPPWHSGLMSEAAKLQLGLDLDNGLVQFPSSMPKGR